MHHPFSKIVLALSCTILFFLSFLDATAMPSNLSAVADKRQILTYSHIAELDFVSPSPGKTVRRFTPGAERWSPGHRGVDLVHPPNTPVVASGSGVVSFAGFLAHRHLVVIKHGTHPLVPQGENLFTVYEPVVPVVTVGETVKSGDLLGYLDPATLHCSQNCLHWGAKWGHGHSTGYLNPWLLLPHLPISLLPWDSVQ